MNKLPVVAIVGRQNVGKSSLLNALAGKRLSIVDPTPGVTRDRVSTILSHDGSSLELVDTAGMGISDRDPFHLPVERQIQIAIERADLVLLVVDLLEGVTSLDRQAAARLRRAGKPVLVVGNKADTKGLEGRAYEFAELGLGDPYVVSAAHRRHVGELRDLIFARLPGSAGSGAALRVAIVGRQNVGKSTLVNALAGEERVIVSEVPGTTRDAVDVHLEKGGRRYVLVDTAGLRKKQKVADSVEFFSHARAREAIARADVAVLLIDVTQKIAEMDKRIASLIEERKKPCVVALNKWDRVPGDRKTGEFAEYVGRAFPLLSYAPVLFISALQGNRIWNVLKLAAELHEQSARKVSTADVNRAIRRAQAERSPGTRGTRAPKIFYATQTRANPPTFHVFVNDPANFTPDYLRFLENKLRGYLPYPEVPLRLALRRRAGKEH